MSEEKGLLDALRRKVEEESGCVVEPERLLSIDPRLPPPEMLVHMFACRHVSGTPRAGGERRLRQRVVRSCPCPRPRHHSPAAERLRDALGRAGGIRYRMYRVQPYESIVEGHLASAVDSA